MKFANFKFVTIILFASYLFVNGCTDTKSESKSAGEKPDAEASCCGDSKETGEHSAVSVFDLDIQWKNQNNKNVALSDNNGKRQFLVLFFSNCTYACPILVNDLKRIESHLNKTALENTLFTLISIDTERDNPEVLKEFALRNSLDLNRWRLLSGSGQNVKLISAALGFKYRKEEDGSFSHSNVIYLIDKRGEIQTKLEGLNENISGIVNAAEEKNI